MFTLRRIFIRSNESDKIFTIFLIGFLVFSVGYLVYFTTDLEHEREALAIATIVRDMTEKTNEYYPEGVYIVYLDNNAGIEELPILSTTRPNVGAPGKFVKTPDFLEHMNDISKESILVDDIEEINLVKNYIKFGKNVGLTHLVIDGKSALPNILNDVFYNEKNYPYLSKQFDSTEHGFKYDIKIYNIDYQLFEKYFKDDSR